MRRPVAVLLLGFAGAWILAVGCSASGSDARINGPSYDLDAGTDDAGADAGQASDAAGPTPTPDASKAIDAAPAPVESGVAADAGSPDDATAAPDAPSTNEAGSCTATTALLGGNDFSLFGAVAHGTSALVSSTLTGSVAATPALVAFGGGFQALFSETTDASAGGGALVGVGYTGSAWSAPSALGGNAIAIDAPAAAVVGATLQAVYLNPQHLYFHAAFATSWDTGGDPVRPPNDAGVTAFGPVRAAAAGTATELVIAYEGSNQLPYAQTWTSAGWDNGVALGSDPLAVNTPLAIVALGGGANDLLVVYAAAAGACSAGSGCLYAVLRSASTKGWSAPALVNAAAYVNGAAPSAPTLAPSSSSGAVLAWEGANGEAYASTYATAGWSTPAQLTAAQVAGAPSLARGICGDDAVAAYVSLGSVYTTHLVGSAWTTPAPLAGAVGVTSVAIATGP
jgi:hypothetical protein